jgi:ribosomal protein S18 acetylase RimI-like enzyme
MIEDAEGVLLVAEIQGQLIGFVGGVGSQTGFYRRLVQKHLLAFGWAASSALLHRPQIASRLWRALYRSSDSAETAADACLMSIAVARSVEGRGVGRLLVEAFSNELRSRNITSYCLTTDRDQNERANCFYQSLGFTLASTYTTPEGRAMNEYVIFLEN